MEDKGVFSISKELAGADLGDKRLNRRLLSIGEYLSRSPHHSFPDASRSVSELEATYRFLGNPKVEFRKILAPHIEATVSRACSEKRVLIAHDTTELLFGGKSRKEELGWVHGDNQGFQAHVSLALSRCESVRPLGVLAIEPLFRKGEPKRKKRRGGKTDPKRESLRWWNSADATQSLFPLGISPIHLADREADDYEFFSDLHAQNMRFVIRCRLDRAACERPETDEKAKLYTLLDGVEVLCEREVAISARKKSPFPLSRKDRHPRQARVAKLHIKAAKIKVTRPRSLPEHLPESLNLNCVHVYEQDCPEGEPPVDWKLFTQEPIESAEAVLNIIDDYRARWMIEEFFKALKTGCAYEKRQLETKEALLNVLAVFAPIAWQLLMLRALNRQEPESPAEYALSKNQIVVLKAVSKKELPERLTIGQALLAIAAIGGHIPNNGAPGWQILARGMEKLLMMELGWNAAQERCDQS